MKCKEFFRTEFGAWIRMDIVKCFSVVPISEGEGDNEVKQFYPCAIFADNTPNVAVSKPFIEMTDAQTWLDNYIRTIILGDSDE